METVELPHYRKALSSGLGWKTASLNKWGLWRANGRNGGEGGKGGGGRNGGEGGAGGEGGEGGHVGEGGEGGDGAVASVKTRPRYWGAMTCSICFEELPQVR